MSAAVLPDPAIAAVSAPLRPPLDIRHLVITEPNPHPTEANGVHSAARCLVREQLAAGDQARLIFLARDIQADERGIATGEQILPLTGCLIIYGRAIRLDRSILRALTDDAGSATVFHLHGGREPLLIDIGRELRRRGIGYAITVHGRYSHLFDAEGRAVRHVAAAYLKTFERMALDGAIFVQALSDVEYGILKQVAPKARIVPIGNGAYSSRLDGPPPPLRPRIRSDNFPHFAYCGRYEIDHKGLDLLLGGFAHYRRRGGQGRLTMIGTGPARSELLELAERLEVAATVQVSGPLFGLQRDAILRGCDYFVMPSRYEGIPLAALEAALLGLPLIVSRGTGLRALVEAWNAGIGIWASSAEAVGKAMHDAEAAGSEWVLQRCGAYALAKSVADWSAITERLRELYLQ